jgi:transcriptional regulator with XRE-family HTH domain
MAQAGRALRQTLEAYGISQNRLAVALRTSRSTVSQWFNETRDPSAESVLDIRDALRTIDPNAAEKFIDLYLNSPRPEKRDDVEL